MHTLLFAVGGYLMGSIPFAYLLARRATGVDLRREGSRNIGARNAYEVTRSKSVGFAVLLLDMLKAVVPLIVLSAMGYCDEVPVVAVAIVFGHSYPVWLKFHGGRGGAAGAAIALLTSPDTLICCCVLYLAIGLFKKQVHIQSALAVFGSLVFNLVLHNSAWFFNYRFICPGDKQQFYLSTVLILALILFRLIGPIYDLLRKDFEQRPSTAG